PTDREQRKEDVKNGFDMMRQQQTDTVRTNIEIELISQSDTSAVVQASYTIQRYQNGAELESAFDVHKQYTLIMSNGKWLISSTGSI
ncbi:MAG: hypothetical protein HN929_13410, partial [Chloroflexi bacterium]|nr:hypothetical protein [Chloroflexota bacterium]